MAGENLLGNLPCANKELFSRYNPEVSKKVRHHA
jgi:hypothetical protein